MSKQKHFILLRGLTRESRHWGNFPSMLQELYPQSSILQPDLPGAGTLNSTKSPLSVQEITHLLREKIDPSYLGKNNIVFIGVSLGGMVGLKWSELYPQDLSEVVVINSSAGVLAPWWKRLKPTGLLTLVRSVMAPQKQHSIIFDGVCRNKENKAHLIPLWEKIHQERPVSLENAHRQIIAAARFKLPAQLTVRGLVLTSQGDDLVNNHCSKEMARYLNWPLKIHSWGGHELPDDDPEWVIKQVCDFIE